MTKLIAPVDSVGLRGARTQAKRDRASMFSSREDDMKELIKRLEKAAGPDRKLDVRIHCRIQGIDIESVGVDEIGVPGSGWTPYPDEWPCYTSSIDAALTLVPALCWARMQTATRETLPIAWATNEVDEHSFEGMGATIAIALCIAALKARSALPSDMSRGAE